MTDMTFDNVGVGKMNNFLMNMSCFDYLISDELFISSYPSFVKYKVHVQCVRMPGEQAPYSSASGMDFCWGFEYEPEVKLSIRGWNDCDADIYMPSDLQGNGIGTVVMNMIIRAIKFYNIPADTRVKKMKLSIVDGEGENKVRRNQFYRNFGFKTLFIDDEEKAGKAYVNSVHELKQHESQRKFTLTPLSDHLMKIQHQMEQLKIERDSARQQENSLQKTLEAQRRRLELVNPVHWLYVLSVFIILRIIMPLSKLDDRIRNNLVKLFKKLAAFRPNHRRP